jgi:class 3 adenylate cyclase/tetratricopeptide (TPR) repeat protein
MGCAHPLGAGAGARREERKVVSVLFCDLVGSTAVAHAADPEDVSRGLSVYHAAVRREIERFGGVVEKFIGDAVVGVWGAPQVHEDDAERSVRAALAIAESVNAEMRVAVNTGEALVRVSPASDPGQGTVVGDVMNTASRLQAVAPVGAVVVGDATMHATNRMIEYEPLAPVVLKGKPAAVPVWRAIGARAAGHGDPRQRTPFFGRARELHLLREVFERALEEPGLQLVTVVGEPGIGKSRLVAELEAELPTRSPAVAVRRGRCIAYGDGIGMWPLAEVVKAQAGIGETESEPRARALLDAAVAGMADAAWLRSRLAPLVGLPGEGGEREEVFAAWQRFFDEVAARGPLVLIFEDLHWADPAMLAFIQYLAEWSTSVAILILCTARPELFESHPTWAGGVGNATTVALKPLGNDDTERLARSLLPELPLPAEVERALVERSGGNPLFAEEYARLLAERANRALSETEMPDTVLALIAARIDTLDGERKPLLHDAAVVGKVFWAGALADMGEREPAVVWGELHELGRKELIRRSRVSTIPGDEEYAFWHDLVHEVAYRQIPRAQRADKHRRAAEWIQRIAGARVADRAELLAFHYSEAVALTRASGRPEDDSLRRAAVHYGAIAAEHAIGLDLERATHLVDKAIELAEGRGEQMARLLCIRGTCLVQAGALAEALHVLEWARSAAVSIGDTDALADAMFQQIEAAYFRGDGRECRRVADLILERFAYEAPSSKVARAIGNAAFILMLRGEMARSLELVDRQLGIAEDVRDPLAAALAINTRGLIHSESGDRARGLDDLNQSLAMFEAHDPPYVTMGLMHLAGQRLAWDGPAAAPATYREAVEHGARTHNSTYEMLARAFQIWQLLYAGDWDDALEESEAVLAWAGSGAHQHAALATPPRVFILAHRGETAQARATMAGAVDRARKIVDSQIVIPTLTVAALLALIGGELKRAGELAAESSTLHAISETAMIAETARVLIASGGEGHAHRLADHRAEPTHGANCRLAVRAMLAEAYGDAATAAARYDDVAQRWRRFGSPFELAHALAGQSRCLRTLGQHVRAEALEGEAASLFDSLGVDGDVLGATTGPLDRSAPTVGDAGV